MNLPRLTNINVASLQQIRSILVIKACKLSAAIN
jgi:predicted solute-binding protein